MTTSKALKITGVVITVLLVVIIKVSPKLMSLITKKMISDSSKPAETDQAKSIFNYDVILVPAGQLTKDLSRNSTKFFVVLDSYDIFARPYFATNETLTKINITDSPNFASNFTKKVYNTGFTSDCSNRRIYILKTVKLLDVSEQVLDVIEYDDTNKFQRIQRVTNMFNGAISIASDWTTGYIYWIEYIEKNKYAIKVTSKLFDKSEYVVQPTAGYSIYDIQIYPKKKEIFFFNSSSVWYTSTSRNSTPKLLFSSPVANDMMDNLVIDYDLNKLCFLYFYENLNCVDIGNSTRPIDAKLITSPHAPSATDNLGVANNTFYWTSVTKVFQYLYYRKNVNDTPNVIARLKGLGTPILSFFSSIADEPSANATLKTTTIFT